MKVQNLREGRGAATRVGSLAIHRIKRTECVIGRFLLPGRFQPAAGGSSALRRPLLKSLGSGYASLLTRTEIPQSARLRRSQLGMLGQRLHPESHVLPQHAI